MGEQRQKLRRRLCHGCSQAEGCSLNRLGWKGGLTPVRSQTLGAAGPALPQRHQRPHGRGWWQRPGKLCGMGFTRILEATLSLVIPALPCLFHSTKAHGVGTAASPAPQVSPSTAGRDGVCDGAVKHALTLGEVTGKHRFFPGGKETAGCPSSSRRWERALPAGQLIFEPRAKGLCGTRGLAFI